MAGGMIDLRSQNPGAMQGAIANIFGRKQDERDTQDKLAAQQFISQTNGLMPEQVSQLHQQFVAQHPGAARFLSGYGMQGVPRSLSQNLEQTQYDEAQNYFRNASPGQRTATGYALATGKNAPAEFVNRGFQAETMTPEQLAQADRIGAKIEVSPETMGGWENARTIAQGNNATAIEGHRIAAGPAYARVGSQNARDEAYTEFTKKRDPNASKKKPAKPVDIESTPAVKQYNDRLKTLGDKEQALLTKYMSEGKEKEKERLGAAIAQIRDAMDKNMKAREVARQKVRAQQTALGAAEPDAEDDDPLGLLR